MESPAQIIIVGAGLAGACAAALLARRGGLPAEHVVLLGDAAVAAPESGAPPQVRVVAVSRASERILSAAGAWTHLPRARLAPYEKMCVWHESGTPEGSGALWFDAAELGEPDLGHIVEHDLLLFACLASFRAAGGRLLPGRVAQLTLSAAEARLSLEDGAVLSAQLVVGADGARSAIREQLGLAVQRRDYHQRALVATLESERPHRHTAWQRFLAGGPLALLPLFDDSVSLVWTVASDAAANLLGQEARAFEQHVSRASGEVLGALRLASERHAFPLVSQVAERYVTSRCALIGDAAHVIHPLAGQGANLGLLDAAALTEVIEGALRTREDPGALRALRRYEQQRRTHNLAMAAAMSVFERGFALGGPIGSALVRAGLGTVQHSAALRHWFARQALGPPTRSI